MEKVLRLKTSTRLLAGLALLLCISFSSYAQNNEITVTGRVSTDSSKLEGATVVLKSDPKKGTKTDQSGNYILRVPANGTLVFSNVGYETQEVPINGSGTVNVLMKPAAGSLNDVVIVGFGGTQKKASAVSSITTVSVKDLKGPTGNLTNAIAGRIPGMISFQQSGEPGLGTNNSTFYIRGLSTFGTGKQDPLILIDGVESSPTDMARLQPDDISDFSVLKDAAAASVYGARGANGVILINTRSGKEGAAKFSFRAENRLSTNTKNFKLADNITYMQLANEATLTRSPNAVQPYTQNKIVHTMAGDDPVLYPNNNWIDQLIKKHTNNQSYNLNINGGGSRARYYIAGGYAIDNGVIKVSPINDFNNNIKLANYFIRSTVNINVTPTTELIVRMYGQFDDYNGPVGGGAATFRNALRANPVAFPAVYPKDKLPYIEHPLFGGGQTIANGALTSTLYVNPFAEMVKGYTAYKTSNIQPQLELKQNLNFITSGLSFRTMAYLRRYSYYDVTRSYNPFYYNAIIDPNNPSNYTLNVLNDGSATSVGTVGTEYLDYSEGRKVVDSRLWLEGSINYNREFAQKHRVGGMLISYMSNYETGNAGSVTASLPQRNQGVSGRFTYAYDDRYLAEINFGYNGSERFAKSKRYGFFPSAGIGYRISNEKFFEPFKRTISDLKLRATYGLVGNDQIGNVNDRFFYLSNVNMNDGGFGSSFGRNDGVTPYYRPGVSVYRYANPNITWELSRQLNLGMDLRLYRNLEVTVDVYKNLRSQILQPKSYTESAYGLTVIPSSNYGKAESRGIDIAAKYERSFHNFWTNIKGTFTYATSKVVATDEIQYPASIAYLSRRGYSMTQTWGLIAERLFVDQKEVANSPVQFGDRSLMAGDIKYRDVNGDGIVNNDDMVPIGYPRQPEIIYGFGASLGYKRLDFSFYFQGSARSSFFIDPAAIQPFFQDGGFQNNLLQAVASSHWSETNQDLYALWPRLSTWRVNPNNASSTWWMRNGNFLRLKSVDLGYTFTDVKGIGLKAPRVYFSAVNLFMFSKFKLWDVEMGGNGLGYPIQSVYSLGAQVNF